MNKKYISPYRITPGILHSVEQIGEALGNLRVGADSAVVTALRRSNRIKTIQASLAIEGNTLSLEQVTAILSGKRILAQPNEINDESRLASDQESDQVIRLLRALQKSQRSASDLMAELKLSHRPTFRKNYLHPALEAGLIEMTQAGTPRARNQKYRLTERGMELLKRANEEEAAGAPLPEYRTDGSGLMVQFNTGIQRKEGVTKKTPEKIIALLKADGSLSISALAEQIGISASTVDRALRKSRESGSIERIGPDKGGQWVVKEK